MKWFLFWAIAATANVVSQPVVSFDTKAECQRFAVIWHEDAEAVNLEMTSLTLQARLKSGREKGESETQITQAMHKINMDGAFAAVQFRRAYTLICKQT